MRYLILAEALIVAETVTGLDSATLAKASRLELLDSALHAPRAGFGNDDFYPSLSEKACARCARRPSDAREDNRDTGRPP